MEHGQFPGWRSQEAFSFIAFNRRPCRSHWMSATRLDLIWWSITIPLSSARASGSDDIVRQHGIKVVCIGSSIRVAGSVLSASALVAGSAISTARTTTKLISFGRQRRRYLRRADAIVAVSRFTMKALMRLMGVDPGQGGANSQWR